MTGQDRIEEKNQQKGEEEQEQPLLIEHVHIMDPASGLDGMGSIRIRDGRIEKITLDRQGFDTDGRKNQQDGRTDVTTAPSSPADREWVRVIDGCGMVAAPGLVDAHVHFRDPGYTWKEDIHTGAAAAAAGGVTSVICMANTNPPVDTPERLLSLRKREQELPVRVYQTATLTGGMKGTALNDLEGLSEAGAVGFTDDGKPVMDEKILWEGMKRAAELGLPISLHEEDPSFVGSAGVHQGDTAKILRGVDGAAESSDLIASRKALETSETADPAETSVADRLHVTGASPLAEEVLAARDGLLALDTGARIDIQHVSSGRTVDILRFLKQEGAPVSAEVTPTHFSLTEEALLTEGTLAKVNPPVRTEWDRKKLIEGLCDGTIDMIVTDHAPHTMEEKGRGFDPKDPAPSGLIGLETSLALGITNLVRPGYLTLMELLRKMTVNPADFYGIPAGRLAEGGPADIVIFNPAEEWTVRSEDFHSKSANSPFVGQRLTGRVCMTICRGKRIYG